MNGLEVALAALAGGLVGAAAGIVPGLHPNTLAVLAIGALPALGGDASMALVAGLVAMGIAHQFTSLLPGGFLGAPAPDDGLRALPAQAMLHEGRAHEAVQLAARGTLWGAGFGLALVLPLRLLLGPQGEGYTWLEPALPVVLGAIAAILLLTETAALPWRRALAAEPFAPRDAPRVEGALLERRDLLLRVATPQGQRWVHDRLGLLDGAALGAIVRPRGRWVRVEGPGSRALGIAAAALVFVLAGGVGLAAMQLATPSPMGFPGSPMFPLLTGLFGLPSLLLALGSGPIPPQRERPEVEPASVVARASASGAACGALVGLLPGMSSSAATVLAMVVSPARSQERILVALNAAGASAAIITVAAYVLVQRARSGAMLAVAEVLPPEPWSALVPPQLLALLALGCVAGIAVGYPATLSVGRLAARVVHAVPYAALSAGIVVALVALVLVATGPLGLAVLAVATCVGLLPWRWGLRKGHLMGCTMVPLLLSGMGL